MPLTGKGWKRRTSAEIRKLRFDLVEEGGGFVKRPRQIGLVFHQHVTVGFLKHHTHTRTKVNK